MNWLTAEETEIAEDMAKCGLTYTEIARELGIALPTKEERDPDDEPELWELEAEALEAIVI